MPQAANLGAHEVIKIHEVLSESINAINTAQLFSEHCKDQSLKDIINRQLEFMTNEYNNMVSSIQQQGFQEAVPYRTTSNFSPTYGLRSPEKEMPNPSAKQIDDRAVASAVMSAHKCSASKRLAGALECANPELRRMLVQGAINCTDQAYELWQFMNSKGYYQVPTMQQNTTNTMLNIYQPSNAQPFSYMS